MSHGAWLQEQLFERRIVLVTGRLDDDAATKAAAALLALDARGNRPIELHLDSPDGALGAAFALIDTADTLRSALRVVWLGRRFGPGNRRGRPRTGLPDPAGPRRPRPGRLWLAAETDRLTRRCECRAIHPTL
jgi:Clp protease